MTPMQELIRMLLVIPLSLFITIQAVVLLVCVPSVYSMLPQGRERQYRAVNFMRRWGGVLSLLCTGLAFLSFTPSPQDTYTLTFQLLFCLGIALFAINAIVARRLTERLSATRKVWDPKYEPEEPFL